MTGDSAEREPNSSAHILCSSAECIGANTTCAQEHPNIESATRTLEERDFTFENAAEWFNKRITTETHNIDKVLTAIAFIFIALAIIIIAATPPATGFEISIYDAYTWNLWFFLIIAIVCGIAIFVHQAFSENMSRWWIAGFSVILFANLVVLLLPIFRGYATSRRYDVLCHIGFIKDIVITGHFGGQNLYPMTHILAVSTSYVTGLKPELLVLLLPTVLFLFYIVSFHLFSRVVAQSYGQALLITAFGSLLLFRDQNSMFFPTLQCFQMVPFILFLLYRAKSNTSKSATYSFLLVVMLFIVPFIHPGEGTFFLLIILACFAFTPVLFRNMIMSSEFTSSDTLSFKGMIHIIGICFVVWFVWFSSFAVFTGSIRIVYDWLVYNVGTSSFQIYSESYSRKIAESEMTLFQVVDLFIKMYGQFALYYLSALAIGIRYWWEFLYNPQKASKSGVLFTVLFTTVGAVTVAFTLLFSYESITRLQNWLFFAATVLNGLGFYELLNSQNIKKVGAFLISLFLIASATIGLFNTFPSPIIRDNNIHVTQMDFKGTEWFLKHQNDESRNVWIFHPLMRFSHASVGYSAIPSNVREGNLLTPPDHFGYKENDVLGMSFFEDVYFVDSLISRTLPLVFPEYMHLLRFTPEDFYHLDNNDNSVNKIYYNGEFWVFRIQGMKHYT